MDASKLAFEAMVRSNAVRLVMLPEYCTYFHTIDYFKLKTTETGPPEIKCILKALLKICHQCLRKDQFTLFLQSGKQ